MPAMEPYSHLMGVNTSMLTLQEKILLEAELFSSICKELKDVFRKQHREYFHLMNFNKEKEDLMLDEKFIQFIVNDILSTEEYNLHGIAYYTDTFKDVVEELAAGRNTNPSAILFRKLIVLHQSVRRALYDHILKKIILQYSNLSEK